MQEDESLKLNDIMSCPSMAFVPQEKEKFSFSCGTNVMLGLYCICNLATKHQKGF